MYLAIADHLIYISYGDALSLRRLGEINSALCTDFERDFDLDLVSGDFDFDLDLDLDREREDF